MKPIASGDSIYHKTGRFVGVCVKREGSYVYHRTPDGVEGNNYEHYYVKVEDLINAIKMVNHALKDGLTIEKNDPIHQVIEKLL